MSFEGKTRVTKPETEVSGELGMLCSVPSVVLSLAHRVYLMVWNNKEKLGQAKVVFDRLQEKLRQTIEPVPVEQLMLGLESPHVMKAIDEFTTKAAERLHHQCCIRGAQLFIFPPPSQVSLVVLVGKCPRL